MIWVNLFGFVFLGAAAVYWWREEKIKHADFGFWLVFLLFASVSLANLVCMFL